MASPSLVKEVVRGNDVKRRRVSVACANCRARKSRVSHSLLDPPHFGFLIATVKLNLSSAMARAPSVVRAFRMGTNVYMSNPPGRASQFTENQAGKNQLQPRGVSAGWWEADLSALIQLQHLS